MKPDIKAGDIVTVKLTGLRANVLKWLDPEEYSEVDETIGKKFLIRDENQKLAQVYDCEVNPVPRTI
jgi:hypothetical protein